MGIYAGISASCDEQRNRLALHVCAHESAVGVVVLKERDQRCGHRDELLGADVDVVHIGAVDQHKVPLTASVHQVFSDFALVVELDVGLRDGVLVLFPCRQIEAEGHVVDGALAFFFELGVEARGFFLFDVIAYTQAAFAGVDDLNEVENARVLDLAEGEPMKPYSLMRAKQLNELMSPMFGPSGVSIGQMRP